MDNKIFAFWTGENAMSNDRRECLDALKKNSGCEVILVTQENLAEYILPNFPLHEAYQYLSFTHRADYLRCYFMHHHGGGYSDIKHIDFSWEPYFRLLDDAQVWAVGYQEIGPEGVAHGVENYALLRENFSQLIGNCAYIFRSKTDFTQQWYDELHRRLDQLLPALKKYPAKSPQDAYLKPSGNFILRRLGVKSKYPVPWSYILGDIVQTLAYSFRANVRRELPVPNFNRLWR